MRPLLVSFLTASLIACGSSGPEPSDGPSQDAGSTDTQPPVDAGEATDIGPALDAEAADVSELVDAGQVLTEPVWRSTTGTPPSTRRGRWGAVMVHDEREGRLILHGGSHYPDGTADDTWAYDIATGVWTELVTTGAPAARFCHCAAYLPETHEVLIVNGRDEGGPVERAAFTLSLDTLEWTRVPGPSPAGLVGCNAVHDPVRSRVLIFGGASTSGFVNQTSAYDPIERIFVTLAPEHSPGPRRDASMVYDSSSDRMLLFGGQTGRSSHARDAWAFDGSDWAKLELEEAPAARRWASSAIDEAGHWLIFGGTNEEESFADLWRFDLTTDRFERLDLENTPTGRAGGAYSYVPDEGAMFIFGGFDAATFGKFDDGWTLSF